MLFLSSEGVRGNGSCILSSFALLAALDMLVSSGNDSFLLDCIKPAWCLLYITLYL